MSSFLTCINRTWLGLINIFFLCISLVFMVFGISLLQYSKSVSNGPEFAGDIDMRSIAYAMFVFGISLGLTAISGCFGALCDHVTFLAIYIGALAFNAVLMIFVGVWSIIQMSNRQKRWNDITSDNWKAFPDSAKDLAQQAFRCCGYLKGDDLAYKGNSENFWNSSVAPVNQCKDGNTLPGCHEAGTNLYGGVVRGNVVVVGLVTIVCIVSILAAVSTRKKRLAVDRVKSRVASRKDLNQPLLF